jgi:hypothetical protein
MADGKDEYMHMDYVFGRPIPCYLSGRMGSASVLFVPILPLPSDILTDPFADFLANDWRCCATPDIVLQSRRRRAGTSALAVNAAGAGISGYLPRIP